MCKKKILSLLGTLFAISLLITIGNAKSHPSSNMSLNYNLNNHVLEIYITHPVSDTNTHYIYKLDIIFNGTTETDYKIYQPTASSFTYYHDIVANIGDIIGVTAYCVQGGSITRQIEVAEPTIPGYLGFCYILGFSVIVILLFIRNKIKKVVK